MLWLIVAAIVVVPLLGLGAVLAGLRSRMAELERVSELTRERMLAATEKLSARAERLQAAGAEVQAKAPATVRAGSSRSTRTGR